MVKKKLRAAFVVGIVGVQQVANGNSVGNSGVVRWYLQTSYDVYFGRISHISTMMSSTYQA